MNETYGDSVNGTMNIGPAHNIKMLQGLMGCPLCDKTLTNNIKIDNEKYPTTNESGEYYILVEPNTGFMVNQTKKTTVYLYFEDKQNLVFPDLDKISPQLIPFYDFSETLSIDE